MAAETNAGASANPSARRALVRAALDLLALTGAAIAQPVLDEFGRASDVFLRAGASATDIVLFALVVAFVPTLALVAIEAGVRLVVGERARQLLHRGLCATLVTLVAVRGIRLISGVVGRPLLVAALVAALAFVVLQQRFASVRQWLAFASPLPVITVVLFLFTTPVHGVLATGGRPRAAVAHVAVAPRSPSVVMLVLDELPVLSLLGADGTIDRARYPGFAALADDSRWFRNTTTVADYTDYAVPAILTGRYVRAGARAATWAEYPDNVFRLLGGAYPMRVSETVTRLCASTYCSTRSRTASTSRSLPARPQHGTPLGDLLWLARDQYRELVSLHDAGHFAPEAGLGESVAAVTSTTTVTTTTFAPGELPTGPPPVRGNPGSLVAEVQPQRFAQLLDETRRGEEPTFHFLHLVLPHGPWRMLPDGTSYDVLPPRDTVPGYDHGAWINDREIVALEHRRHLLQLEYTSRLVGRLVSHLRDQRLWDNTIVVVVADHGAAFTPGAGFRRIDAVNADEILGVPLFVHAPGVRPGVDDRFAQTVDVLPTLAALLHVHVPWTVDGRSLLDQLAPRRSHPFGASGNFTGTAHVSTIDVAHHLEHLLTLARRRAQPPPTDDAQLALLRTGPHGDWLGRAVPRTTARIDADVVIDAPSIDELRAPRPDRPAPLLVAGDAHGLAAGTAVVVAVDGRVAAVTLVFASGRRRRVVAFLDERALQPGHHDVRFYAARQGSLDALEAITVS